MKTTLLLLTGMVLINGCTREKAGSFDLQAVSPEFVVIKDSFWLPLIRRNNEVTIPYAFRKCEETGRIENFAMAAGISEKKHEGERYNDSDVFKIIEGAAGKLALSRDPSLEQYVDSLINLIGKAQEDDGYLYTSRSADPENPTPGAGENRWADVWISHELYNAGHLYEAAVAYYKATGKDQLLNIARKNANLVCNIFGWGKKEIAPGHQEIELGLIRLYEVTGEDKYLEQARFFLDVRGRPQDHPLHPEGTRFAIYNNEPYLQQHLPVLKQTEAVGHAVRATYMYTAMTDLARYLPECDDYLAKSKELWEDVVNTKTYLTGGIGAVPMGESFGPAYYLPNKEAYNETCAAIGNVFWNYSLFLSTGESKYIDVMECTLYNGLISGISQDGMHFFYPNPLASDGNYERSPWFGVACCPGNICRFMPQVPGYIYSKKEDEIYVNLFITSGVTLLLSGRKVSLNQNTRYPWTGKSTISIETEKNLCFTLKVRIPAWLGITPLPGNLYYYADSVALKPQFRVNGKPVTCWMDKGFASITRKWKDGDSVEVYFPLSVRKVMANEQVEADKGCMALERGPIVYCLEEADNGKIKDLELEADFVAEQHYEPDFFGGSTLLQLSDSHHQLTAIPYFLWANREPGEMEVWFKVKTR